MIKLILASQSPRRRELIKLLGYPFQAITADVNENLITDPDPMENVRATAQLKASAMATRLANVPGNHNVVIIAADTTVALDGQMLGKPDDETDARRMLIALRNRQHEVHTGVSLLELATGCEVTGVNTAVVTMRNYTDSEITDYIATGDPMDKAGAYAIQHPVFRPVDELDGCFTSVMGLSVCHLIQLFPRLALPIQADFTAFLHAHQRYSCSLYDMVVR